MRWRAIVALWGLCGCASTRAAPRQYASVAPTVQLPRPFLGVDWKTNSAELIAAHPGAESDSTTTDRGKRQSTTVMFDEPEYFGQVAVTLVGPVDQDFSHHIRLELFDRRTECNAEDRDPAVHCINRFSKTLIDRFQHLEAGLIQAWGPPTRSILPKDPGPKPKPNERASQWLVGDVEIVLELYETLTTGWTVALTAIQRNETTR